MLLKNIAIIAGQAAGIYGLPQLDRRADASAYASSNDGTLKLDSTTAPVQVCNDFPLVLCGR